jgi:hypothetical protein
MQFKKMIAIQAENYQEEQFLLTKFPDAIWIALDWGTNFYVSETRINEVLEVLNEWKRKSNQ